MATAALKINKINLIPWDHTSEAHVERLIAQRKACGWGADEVVSSWVPRAEKGLKTMFWVVLADSLPDREQLHQAHKEKYPNETTPLHDTARSLNLTPREPSGVAFVPIGHVAMNNDPTPDLAEHASRLLPETGVYWISSLYISPTMQARGLGRAVMSHLESLVAQGSPPSGTPPPTEGLPTAALAGTTIALDTPPKEWHTGTWALDNFWDPLGLPRPKISNQEWYQQQGYTVFAELPAHRPTEMPSGVVTDVPLLLLKKVLR